MCAKPNANFFFNFLAGLGHAAFFPPSSYILYVLFYIRPRTVRSSPETRVRTPGETLTAIRASCVLSLVVVIKNKEKFCTEQDEKKKAEAVAVAGAGAEPWKKNVPRRIGFGIGSPWVRAPALCPCPCPCSAHLCPQFI